MKDDELIRKAHAAMYRQCQDRGFATTVDVLMDISYATHYVDRKRIAELKMSSSIEPAAENQ